MARAALILSLALTACISAVRAQAYLTPLDFGLKVGEHGMVDYQNRPANVLIGKFNQDNYPDILRFNGSKLELFLFSGKGYAARPLMQKSFCKPIVSLHLEGEVWSSQRDLVVTLINGEEEAFGYKNGVLDLRENEIFGESLAAPPRQIDEFDFQIVWQSETYPFGFASCAVGDLDNDGIEELVSYRQEDSFSDSAWILIYKCTGDNQYELFMQECFNPDISTQSGVSQMLIGDIDQNGQKELILTYDKCYFWEFSAPGVYFNWRSDFIFPRHVDAIKAADVDQDGIMEIAAVMTNSEMQPPTYYMVEEFDHKSNPPDSTIFFNAITWFGQNWSDYDMDVGDFDNDGAVDLVSGNFYFVIGYDPVETQYFRYDETSYSPPNFRQYWLNAGIPLSCANPVIADLDGDGDFELFAGGLYPQGGSAFVWEPTGLQAGYVAWLDTTSALNGPHESSCGIIDGESCVAAAHIIPAPPPSKSFLLLWAHADSTYTLAWRSAVQDCCYYCRPVVADPDHDGKMSIIEADYIYPQAVDWEQTAASTSDLPATPLPNAFYLHGCHPNPFNSSTTIQFDLRMAGPARLSIFNITGEIVYIREEPLLPVGHYFWKWQAEDLASGIYLINLRSGGIAKTRKAVLMK